MIMIIIIIIIINIANGKVRLTRRARCSSLEDLTKYTQVNSK